MKTPTRVGLCFGFGIAVGLGVGFVLTLRLIEKLDRLGLWPVDPGK